VQLSKLLNEFEKFWPELAAEDWDRVGLVSGDPDADISRILVAVDLTISVIEEAEANQCQLIVTHHPALLRGVNSVAEDQLKGKLFSRLIRAGVASFAAHTNADVQMDGATSIMASRLGLKSLSPITSTSSGFGHGILGTLPAPVDLGSFATLVSKQLPIVARKVVFAGNAQKEISKVAICSGAGDSFMDIVLKSEADVFITSDLRHHVALDAIETPRPNGQLALIDVSHWASESLWVAGAIERIAGIAGVAAIASKIVTDPWTEEVF
jgi:dinuclear metal center YbgI/SA1388 family protein